MTSPNTVLTKVYDNIFNFLEYRGLHTVDNDQMNNVEFIRYINNNEYVIIDTENTIGKHTFIVLFHHSTQTTFKTQDFKKLMTIVSNLNKEKTKGDKKHSNYDVITITQAPLSTHVNNFISQINQMVTPHKETDKCPYEHDEKFCTCYRNNIYSYTYANFIIQIPKHVLVPEYRVLSATEEKQVIQDLRIKKGFLPKINVSDPMVIWSTAIKGSIIEITRCDDVAGEAYYYRIVV